MNASGVEVALYVQPGARRSAVVGEHGGRLKLALQAPPIEGRANEALVEFVSAALGIPRQRVVLVAGERSRNKRVALLGVDAAAVVRTLAPVRQ